ncbi:thiamine pyrophosphate-dependent enzyme [Alicyclobacillus sp. SO9]|uniref:thiamine pyrophosphate-dependent enzyme n=1 Tax=Alicyclobacillus sp. SO9 TaxID=2665646 RepID=UPI0018E6FB1B|nr:thiamine pyrophosphate-dependent enzyme [Alicyclobacillus sp. SO9]QQE80568.1 hypothetical protein GI364_09250 [Alicyclobacillus sp. SO9]
MSTNPGGRMNARDAFHQWLTDRGISRMFGNPGSTELPMLVDWPKSVEYVLGLQESVVVAMADVYAQTTGMPALVNLHAAQGLGNAMGSLRTALHNHAPMVVTVGQEDTRHQILNPLLYGDMVSLGQPVVKWAYEVKEAADVVPALERAWHFAEAAPAGPVLLSIPMNLWDGPATKLPIRQSYTYTRTTVNPEFLSSVAEALSEATSPALVLGGGVARSDAFAEAVALAERLQCPVYGAPLAERMGFPNQHPLYEGMLQPVLPLILQTLGRYDVVVVIGAPVFLTYPYLPGPRGLPMQVYHIDDIDVNLSASLAQHTFQYPVKGAIAALANQVVEANHTRPNASAARRAQRKSAAIRSKQKLGAAFVLGTVSRMVAKDTVVIDEGISASPLVREYVNVFQSAQYFSASTGGLGWGIPAAIGAALARPGQKVVAIVGDGASLYGIQALWTLARLNLPVGVIVLNNQRYAILNGFGKMLYPSLESTIPGIELPGLNLVKIAEGFGVSASRIDTAAALESALESALNDGWRFDEGDAAGDAGAQSGQSAVKPFLLDVAVSSEDISLM